MPHTVHFKDGVIDVRYTGEVGYTERASALKEVIETAAAIGLRAPIVLGDFSNAVAYEENPGARADFIATVITTPWREGSRVALVNLSEAGARPAKSASDVRGPLVQTFANRNDALAWLVGDRVPPSE